MAEDLIRQDATGEGNLPVPRPAGAPLLTPPPGQTAQEPHREPDQLVKPPPPEWRPGPHANRFIVVYGALGLVLGAAVVLFAGLVTGNNTAVHAAWSAWKPAHDGSARVREIASHVADGYRTANGRELVAVVPRAPRDDPPVAAVAIDEQALFQKEQQFKTYSMDDGLMYVLCGEGTNCAIGTGSPTIERHRLLRREALELALYTFHYVNGVDSVVAFLPPRPVPGTKRTQSDALYFRKSAYKQYAELPIRQTLPGHPRENSIPDAQASVIDQLTAPVLFSYGVQRTPDGRSAILILTPYPSSG